jgi:Kef-type K+ transport system membrane component KefB
MTTLLPLATSIHQVEAFLLHVLIELAVIIAAARLGGWLLGKLGQPQVVGEIAAGILLGPSCLKRLAPELWQAVFQPGGAVAALDSAGLVWSKTGVAFGPGTFALSGYSLVIKVLSEIGLVLLMFLIGLEFEFGHLKQQGRSAAGVAVAGIVVPFTFGVWLAWWMYPDMPPGLNRTGFTLFMAVALSITAIPILGRIMMEFNITRTALGALTITAAAIDDAVGWILLATISAIVAGDFQVAPVAQMLGLTLGMVLACRLVVRPIVVPPLRRVLAQHQGELPLGALTFLLLLIFASAVATSWIGIFAIFGPFVLGAVLWDQHELREAAGRRLRQFVTAFFLPIFFTSSGLNTDIGLLDSGRMWMFCGLVSLAAIAGKMLGCGLAARLGGLGPREAGCVAVMMNTRALMGLIAINVGRDLGVIPDSVFGMLVLMALVTTFMAAPLLRWLLRGTELEPWYNRRHQRGSTAVS